jgi:hypothetical protein
LTERATLIGFSLAVSLFSMVLAPRADAAPRHPLVPHRADCCCLVKHDQPVGTYCKHEDRWRPRKTQLESRPNDWYLHRPSTPAERAQTAELNRKSLPFSQPIYNAPWSNGASSDDDQYQRALREYRAARREYDQQMWLYSEQVQHSRSPHYSGSSEQHFAAPVAPHYIPAPPQYQNERPNPWHGYNPNNGPGNGY